MLQKNEIYEVEIIDNGYNGEGIAKVDNFPIFIEGAIKGEIAKIKILKVQSSFAYGKIIEITKQVSVRKEADCTVYPKCRRMYFKTYRIQLYFKNEKSNSRKLLI